MSRNVFSRVITGQLDLDNGLNIELCEGTLEGYERHGLKGLDYPAIIAKEGAQVPGMIAYNLTDDHVKKLDVFEGDEYLRTVVTAWDRKHGKYVPVNAYVWTDDESMLLPGDWDFEGFVKNKMANWVSDEMSNSEGIGNRFWNPDELDRVKVKST